MSHASIEAPVEKEISGCVLRRLCSLEDAARPKDATALVFLAAPQRLDQVGTEDGITRSAPTV